MSKARLIQRLQWYYPTEKLHAYGTFPLILLYAIVTNPISEIVLLIYGMILCIIVLYQGQHYWKLKLWRLRGQKINQTQELQFFRKSKKVNVVLILLMPVIFLFQWYVNQANPEPTSMFYWGILANVVAMLEHINYYHIQLMIDNKYDLQYVTRNKRLKRSSLAKDLEEQQI